MAQMQRDVVVIGASSGGVDALLKLASELPGDLPAAVFIAIHMAAGYASRLPELLSAKGPLHATHPVDGEVPSRGRIYVAPPDNHLMLRAPSMSVARGPKENGFRPSVDALFRSAATTFGPRVIGVVLTGHLDCGTAGLLSIKARGGTAVVQDPREAQVPSMPSSALANVQVDHVVGLDALASLLIRLTREPASFAPVGVSGEVLELEGERLGAPAPLVCPTCQGVLTEAQVGDFTSFRCHVGHAFSMPAVIDAQAESQERALWAAARALEESAALSQRMAQRSSGSLKQRFEDKEQEQRRQADTIKQLLMAQGSLDRLDSEKLIEQTTRAASEDDA